MLKSLAGTRGATFSKRLMLVAAIGFVCTTAGGAPAWDSEPIIVLPLTYSLQVVTRASPTSDPACPLKVEIEGAGLTDLLGAVHDQQTHCAHPDGSVDQGVFTFTGAVLGGMPGGEDSADSITGQYRAHLIPSIASVFTNPPSGYWLTFGEVCILEGTGRFAGVVNDCPTSTSQGRFFPARLTLDLDTGQANVFGTAVVRIRGVR